MKPIVLGLLLAGVRGLSEADLGSVIHTDCVGDIRLESVIGKGRRTFVFKAHQEGDPAKSYAVKSNEVDQQLAREAEVLSALSTKNGFPKYFCTGRDFVVMELLSNYKSLAAMHADSQSPPISIEDIAIQAIDRLEAVHEAGFVHVDVHKRNIMVGLEGDDVGKVDLIDFGLAAKISEQEKPEFVNLYLSSIVEQRRQPLHPIDDIERLMYVLLHYGFGELPWAPMVRMHDAIDQEQELTKEVAAVIISLEQRIHDLKLGLGTSDEEGYFDTHTVPPGFRAILQYVAEVRPLRSTQSFAIDYNKLRSALRETKAAVLPVRQLRESNMRQHSPQGPSLLPIIESRK